MKRSRESELKREGRAILDAIERIKEELAAARMNFDMATDDALIDSYIYEISALNSRYQYYLQKAKGCGLIAEGFDEITA